MIKKQDRDQYLSLVNSLTNSLLRDELIDALEKRNDFNNITLRQKIDEISSLALDIIDTANDKFNQSLEDAGELDKENELSAAEESALYYAKYDREHK